MHLNLRGTDVTDAGLDTVGKLKSLVRLHLERTKITDAGLAHLKGLTNLEYLNLYGTGVTDGGLEQLTGLKKLKKLYVWETKASQGEINKLKGLIAGIEIVPDPELDMRRAATRTSPRSSRMHSSWSPRRRSRPRPPAQKCPISIRRLRAPRLSPPPRRPNSKT